MLEFDLGRQSLATIEMPSEFLHYNSHRSFQIMPAEDGGICLAILSYQIMELWERKISSDGVGVAEWTMLKKIELGVILGLGHMGGWQNLIVAYDEDYQLIFVRTINGVFMIHLESMQFKNLGKDNFDGILHAYSAFCTAVGDLPRAERRVGTISEIMGFDEDDSNSADPPKGAGAVEGNAAAPSCETIPDEGMVDNENLDYVWNHGERIGEGFKCKYCKMTRKSGRGTRLKEHLAGRRHNVIACSGVPPKVRKAMRISLNKVKQRTKAAKNRRAKMKKPNTQNMVRHGVHNNSKEQQMQMAKQLSLEEFHYRQKMEKRGSTFEYGGGSDSRSAPDACCNVAGSCVGGGVVLPQPSSKTRLKLHGMDADDVYRGASAQTEIGTSELRKAWAEWFHNNGIPGIKADCPYFRRAMELTQQLGFNVAVPTGAEIDGAYLDADEEEINVDAINAEKSCEAVLDMPLITWTKKHIGKNHKANKKYHEMANTLTQDLGSPGSKRKRVEVKQGKQPMNNKEEFMGSDDEMGIPSDMSNMPR
ncbi:hypothetical protein OsI_32690 [Oryza sativa Indica Group]|uniref:BED-type domain-containing protein n=1 Tax=Oryza sativa subsp. indica TaxID=39946 RepID=B8BFN2_ORYSI|nr:hypothetical protein OsI_32690 [Oryza sativa Indica Group]